LFISILIAASCGQLRHEMSMPRGDRTGLAPGVLIVARSSA
jgi:hypothetical protein